MVMPLKSATWEYFLVELSMLATRLYQRLLGLFDNLLAVLPSRLGL